MPSIASELEPKIDLAQGAIDGVDRFESLYVP